MICLGNLGIHIFEDTKFDHVWFACRHETAEQRGFDFWDRRLPFKTGNSNQWIGYPTQTT